VIAAISTAIANARASVVDVTIERPSVERAKVSLSRFTPKEVVCELWRGACRDAGIREDTEIDLVALRLIAARLESEPGLIGVSAAALRIRIDAYLALERAGASSA